MSSCSDSRARIAELERRCREDGDRAQDYFERMKVANAKLEEIRQIVVANPNQTIRNTRLLEVLGLARC